MAGPTAPEGQINQATTQKSTTASRTEAAFVLPGKAALTPKDEANRALADAEALQQIAKAQKALNDAIEAETGETVVSTAKITPKK